MEDIIYLKDSDDMYLIGSVVIFNEAINVEDFETKLKAFVKELLELDDYNYDSIYDFIVNTYNVKEIIHLDNLKEVRF